ncbi:endophilin-A2-like isoform X2 [Nelusetta ayraudi]|uniref:endophilin-A2-like isoform X2 n=1 Tax=Nelusetta ayraudi TaxID=303726 RepID=UPI003F6ECF68
MSVAGLKKQLYKASQIMSEKVGGAEGTKLDGEFQDLERRADTTSKALVEILAKSSDYLQPNPTVRAKLNMVNTVSKMRGQEQASGYPHPEGLLGDSMIKYGNDLGAASNFGGALLDFGESMKQLSQSKDALDISVKHNFIDPVQIVVDQNIKDVQHHLKKMEGRRLDYDYKKKRQGKIPDEEIQVAQEKFNESKELSGKSMVSLLELDVEHVAQLSSFATSLADYHRQAIGILEELSRNLSERSANAVASAKTKYEHRPVTDYRDAQNSNGSYAANPPSYSHAPAHYPVLPQRPSIKSKPLEPCCKVLYDFVPENEGELGLKMGDIVTLVSQIDDNWYEGAVHGQTGFFPVTFVEVMVPLSH